MTRTILFVRVCTCARDAINGTGSYSYEQEEAFQICRASITVCVSEGNSLWKDKRDQWDSKQRYQASGSQENSQATMRTCACGGDTRWTYLELTSTAFCIRLSRRSVLRAVT